MYKFTSFHLSQLGSTASSDYALSSGAIAGIVIGIIGTLCIIIGIIFFVCWIGDNKLEIQIKLVKKEKKKTNTESNVHALENNNSEF